MSTSPPRRSPWRPRCQVTSGWRRDTPLEIRTWRLRGTPGLCPRTRPRRRTRLSATVARRSCLEWATAWRPTLWPREPGYGRATPASLVVGKIGAPFEAELAIGAIADGADPELVTDPLFIADMDISPEYFEESKAAVFREVERRRQVYLGNRPPLEVAGRTVIIVDDGIATGATMLAALRATRRRRPARIVLAVPVASKATLKRLREEADQIVCVATPRNLRSVGRFYQRFTQLRDTEVTELLAKARNFVSSTRAGGP